METMFPELNMNKQKMNMKRILVSFLLVVSIVFFATAVSAAPLATGDSFSSVEVDGVELGATGNPAITAGETITVRVEFNSDVNVDDVTVEVELETDGEDVQVETLPFVVEEGFTYVRTLELEVPFDLEDQLSDFATLNVEVSGNGDSTEESFDLRVQRESFNVNIQSVFVPQTVSAGNLFPVDIVLKNQGYNNLDDLYVTASIPALGIERTDFFGDLVALACDDDNTAEENFGVDVDRNCDEDDADTLVGRIFLEAPFSAESGTYTLEIEVENDDMSTSQAVQVEVQNDFSAGNFIVSGSNLLIVNPTNNLAVYRLVPENTATASVSLSETLVAVPAGSSKTVSTSADSSIGGTFTYKVHVFSSNGELVDTVQFTKVADGDSTSSPIVVLTVILAIIFIVLLVVLIVLIGKKPKSEDFGESYY